MSLSKPRKLVMDGQAWCEAVCGVAKKSDATELNYLVRVRQVMSKLKGG